MRTRMPSADVSDQHIYVRSLFRYVYETNLPNYPLWCIAKPLRQRQETFPKPSSSAATGVRIRVLTKLNLDDRQRHLHPVRRQGSVTFQGVPCHCQLWIGSIRSGLRHGSFAIFSPIRSPTLRTKFYICRYLRRLCPPLHSNCISQQY